MAPTILALADRNYKPHADYRSIRQSTCYECAHGRGSLNAALWGRLRGPGVLGLAAEDRLRLGALERPVAPFDLSLKLTRCPAGVADEDPQTVHGLVAAKQLEKQLPVRSQVDAVEGLDRVLGRRVGAK